MRVLAIMAIALLMSTFAQAQTPAYRQTEFQGNPNGQVVVESLTPALRIPVRTTPAAPVINVQVRGYAGMYCARDPLVPVTTAGPVVQGELEFRDWLYVTLRSRDLASMRASLQRAERSSVRAEQFRELFGVALPPLSATLYESITLPLSLAEQDALNMGQPLTTRVPVGPQGNPLLFYHCATGDQIDAAITTAKQVYAAVIAAMEGSAKPSSGIKPQ